MQQWRFAFFEVLLLTFCVLQIVTTKLLLPILNVTFVTAVQKHVYCHLLNESVKGTDIILISLNKLRFQHATVYLTVGKKKLHKSFQKSVKKP